MAKFTKEQATEALIATKGQITLAARKMGCAYNTLRAMIDKYPELKEVMQEQHEQMGDTVELALFDEAVNKRNIHALMFLAKTKFKERGYVERIESTGANGGAIEVNVRKLPPLPDNTLDEILNASDTDET